MNDRTFAEKLRHRIDADPMLTEAGLAVSAGLSNATIRRLMTGASQNPRVDTAMKICQALGTTLEEFMGQPQTEEERRIARLMSRLSIEERRQLLGYGEGLLSSQDQPRPQPE